MSMTDPIADLLTRIRNGLQAKHVTIDVPASKLKVAIVQILAAEGYVEGSETFEEGPQKMIRIRLKYASSGARVVTGLERVSRPGLRVYCGKDEIPKVLGGLGINILSTPRGILTGNASRKAGVGGEILCNIW